MDNLTSVIRNGAIKQINIKDLVVGDICCIKYGENKFNLLLNILFVDLVISFKMWCLKHQKKTGQENKPG